MQHERIAVSPATSVKLVIGLFLTAIGLLWTIDNLRIADTGAILRFWPVVLIAIGLLTLRERSARTFSLVSIGLGTLWLLGAAGILKHATFAFWPFVLIVIGTRLVLQAFGAGTPPAAEGTTVWGVLSTQELNAKDRAFEEGRAFAFLGTAKVDLTSALPAQGPAILEVFALMGAVEIYVPDGWHVQTEAVPFMAGIESNTRSRPGGRELVVRGFVMMGGIEVKDVTGRKA